MSEVSRRGETATPSTASEDRREQYEPPELKDLGDANKLTQTSFVTAGTDSGYS
jgi:hypothetical protein